MIIVSNRYRIATNLVPKCGSTTIVAVMGAIHDLLQTLNERHILKATIVGDPAQIGQRDMAVVTRNHAAEVARKFGDYVWFTVSRDPHDRVVSNYNNKLNRFSARFRPDLHWRYRMREILGGPRVWRDNRLVMPWLTSQLSYSEFVETLVREGIDWDPHYKLQTDIMRLDLFVDAKILRLETLSDELPKFLSSAGVDSGALQKLGPLPRLNRSAAEGMRAKPEIIAMKDKVFQLYRKDFETLGYPR
jgi:hypothetical protein